MCLWSLPAKCRFQNLGGKSGNVLSRATKLPKRWRNRSAGMKNWRAYSVAFACAAAVATATAGCFALIVAEVLEAPSVALLLLAVLLVGGRVMTQRGAYA